MKKFLITTATLALVLVMGAMLAACSANAAGTYELESMAYYINGELQDEIKAGDEGFDETKQDGKLVLNEDGTGEFGVSALKWEQKGNEITFTVEDIGAMKGTLNGKTLTVTTEETAGDDVYNEVLVYKKV